MGETVKVAKRAKVWNDGTTDFKHVVMGQEVFIPVGGMIECSRSQAFKIRGHFTGKHEPVTLRIELIESEVDEQARWIDHQTGREFPTKEALMKHLGIDPKEADAAKSGVRYPCPGCNRVFSDAEKARAHMATCLAGLIKPSGAERVNQ